MADNDTAANWKAGAAKNKITPKSSIWMGGYANREKPSEGVSQDLWVKALVIQDQEGSKGIIVTSDLIGFPKNVSDNIIEELRKHNIERSEIILNSSHTHSGPVVKNSLYDIYPLDKKDKERIEEYTEWLESEVVKTVLEAYENMVPAELFVGQGEAAIGGNRREEDGPYDHSVPVLKVVDAEHTVMAVVFGYACHNTTLGGLEFSGDYAGYAQEYLEEKYSSAKALFTLGAGANINPQPRGEKKHLLNHGKALSDAVCKVLDNSMTRLDSKLKQKFSYLDLPINPPPSQSDLKKIIERNTYQRQWAEKMLKKYERGDDFIDSYPYPIQIWQLGENQTIITMGGEVVVDYALKFKKLFNDQSLWVMGYCNDVMGYIPNLRVHKKGGYEGGLTGMLIYGMPSTWDSSIEDRITDTVTCLYNKIMEKS